MEAALAICRFVHFAATMALFGGIGFLVAFAPPELARALTPAARRLAGAAIPLAAFSALAWLALEAASMTDSWASLIDPEDLRATLFDTAFGVVWQGRLLLALALLGALALGRAGPSPLLAAASALLLASLGLVGHAAMQSEALGALHRANDAIHLLAAAGWIGGLPFFALSLDAYRRPELRAGALTAMRRFSFWGHFDVALIVLTGLVNVALTSGLGGLAPTSPYRALLLAKITLVATMIGIAFSNRYFLAPRLKPGAPAERRLMQTCLAEAALGGAVIALVSVFGQLDPFA